MRQLEGVAVFGRFIENVALGADVADERHDQLFADGVDGRIGDLGKELLEVVEERLSTIREAGKRHIGAHGADWLFAVSGHRREKNAEVFFAVSAGALAAEQCFGIEADDARGLGQRVNGYVLLLEPFGVRLARGERLLDLAVGDDALLDRVNEEHAAGLETAFFQDVLGRSLDDAGLGGEDN